MTIAYLANSFPEPVEPYVWEEIRELRKHGARVIPCSMRRPQNRSLATDEFALETLYVLPMLLKTCLGALWLCIAKFWSLTDLLWRVINGSEPFSRQLRCLAHTWLGACLAARLRGKDVRHIHVHHGYFAAWAGMVAARLLNTGFSITLHGSDLLLRADYLDAKLANCRFCITVSDFNRQYILDRYPSVDPGKVIVQRLGIDPRVWREERTPNAEPFTILSVGRLHAVKNHAFLLLACRALKSLEANFHCLIAGEGEERQRLHELIISLGLENEVTLLGHVAREQLPQLYAKAAVVVLTSRSEGLPVTLMEAMATGCIVIAPEMTGIPELIFEGKTGFLYQSNSMEQFLTKLQMVLYGRRFMETIRQAARQHIERHFNGPVNLAVFADRFLQLAEIPKRVGARTEANENPVLQQI